MFFTIWSFPQFSRKFNSHNQQHDPETLITQFSNANATLETFSVFQQKIFNLVDSATSNTHRKLGFL
jgi:hypothetical protein